MDLQAQKNLCILMMFYVFFSSCNPSPGSDNPFKGSIEVIEEDLTEANWMNEPKTWSLEEGVLHITALEGSDYFNNPIDSTISGSAPFIYWENEKDFIATALVEPDFNSIWNAVSIMVYQDSLNWIKFAFENSDATGKSLVSVVTKEISDDANGPILSTSEKIWLRIIRKGNLYAMHWSEDGEHFKMKRLSALTGLKNVFIGIEAQSPVGKKATHKIHSWKLEEKTVDNLRKGV